jgi:hypothetical protein
MQTEKGRIKARETMLKKFGPDYFKTIGSKGGKNGTGHAFGHGKVDPHIVGKIGGSKSKRTKEI